jgi:hypothetical protein
LAFRRAAVFRLTLLAFPGWIIPAFLVSDATAEEDSVRSAHVD